MRNLTLVSLIALATLGGCAAPRVDDAGTAYLVADDGSLAARWAPVFVVQGFDQEHNLIGAPAARVVDGRESVYVDATRPTIFWQRQDFRAAQGPCTNLIYRVHFPGVPMPNLTAGRNVGIFVILTLDQNERPVLVTTLHTCGCYLAIIPTPHLPVSAYGANCVGATREVHGETLPGRVDLGGAESRLVVVLRADTHRVMDLRVWTGEMLRATASSHGPTAALAPMESLQRLPLEDGSTTSFYYEKAGRRQGYVKDSVKPLEMWLMGWWALDLYVGRDKQLGDPDQTGVRLYTSLKPWNRRRSSLHDWPEFLEFWGWRL